MDLAVGEIDSLRKEMSMLQLKDIRKNYEEGDHVVRALRGISLQFRKSEFVSILGPSGCGKTTLLSLLLGLEAPDQGEILGLEGLRKSAVFQEDRLCENAGAVSNIRLVNPALTKGETEGMLRELGLSDSLRQPVRTLSGGMKRRVAILRALAADYDVLFCDEPFKGLDQDTKTLVMGYFVRKTQGKTVILVTHDKSEAQALGGELLLL